MIAHLRAPDGTRYVRMGVKHMIEDIVDRDVAAGATLIQINPQDDDDAPEFLGALETPPSVAASSGQDARGASTDKHDGHGAPAGSVLRLSLRRLLARMFSRSTEG